MLRMVADASLPSFRATSTSNPPRARRPFTEPAGHAFGSAGSKSRIRISDFHFVALQQHLRDAGCAAEIAVNLERRVRVEQVWINASALPLFRTDGSDQQFRNVVSVLGVLKPRPEIQTPTHAPTSGLVAANLQRFAHGSGQCRRAAQRDVVSGEKSVEMRDAAMMNVARLHVPVFEPFLKLAGLADLVRRKPGARGGELRAEFLVPAENFPGADAVGEQVAQPVSDWKAGST